MSGKSKAWSDTQLWKQLKQRAAKPGAAHVAAKEMLPQMVLWMNQIEQILSKGHTDPQDFTLHDDEHSFRVAERMMELVRPTDRKHLSDYEIALLLLAAYLHDIGMNPERKKVSTIHQHLITKGKGLLTDDEASDLQRWLDESGWDLEPPICKAAPTLAELDLADEITTYYVRHKHNDWSKEWIDKNLAGSLHALSDWRDVLVRLCQSHHMDYRHLRGRDFDPRSVGNHPPQRLHLRHLACLLRVADILENSPDRVPKIIFQHRNIENKPKSFIHWEVPHQLEILITDGVVHVRAEPLEARFEKAIRSLVDDIDKELAGCAAIAKDLPFKLNPILGEAARDWLIAPASIVHIHPHNNAYDYIEGAFRPNTSKLLELLSGTQLYHTPLAAVRELLQNAFDAVREKIARNRLKQEKPADPTWEQVMGNQESVTLTLINDSIGGLRLTCQDTGCGMTKEIIQNHVLVSGDGRRPALIDLERQCKKAGFDLGRTGQFGIGVLSYFMLAKRVSIKTCRLQDCGDLDAPGWTFTTGGVGDFGELRKLPSQPPTRAGTLIEWGLDGKKFPDARELADELEKYLRRQLVRIPCGFRFLTEFEGQKSTIEDLGPGWVFNHKDIIAATTTDWDAVENDKQEKNATNTAKQIAARREFLKRLPGWMQEARDTLRLEERIIPMPENSGLMRVILPWFELPEGPAFAYVFRDREMGGRVFGGTRVLLQTKPMRKFAWKGISSGVNGDGGRWALGLFPNNDCSFGWIDCDFTNVPGSQLMVNRASLSIQSVLSDKCRVAAQNLLTEMVDDLLKRGLQPPFFGVLTDIMLARGVHMRDGCGWFHAGQSFLKFAPIKLPCAMLDSDRVVNRCIDGRNKSVDVLSQQPIFKTYGSELRDYGRVTRVVCEVRHLAAGGGVAAPAWLLLGSDAIQSDDALVPFPPEWRDVWVSGLDSDRSVLNIDHWAVKLVKPEMFELVRGKRSYKTIDWNEAANIHIPTAAALTLMKASMVLGQSGWNNLNANHPHLLPRLWQICAEAAGRSLQELKLVHFDGYQWDCMTHDSFQRSGYGRNDYVAPAVTDPDWILETFVNKTAG